MWMELHDQATSRLQIFNIDMGEVVVPWLMLVSTNKFCTTEHSLLSNMELSLLKSEVEVEVPPPEPKKCGECTVDDPRISATPAKKREGELGSTGTMVHPTSVKRKVSLGTSPSRRRGAERATS